MKLNAELWRNLDTSTVAGGKSRSYLNQLMTAAKLTILSQHEDNEKLRAALQAAEDRLAKIEMVAAGA